MKNEINSDEFRNSISTVSKEGKRIWIYPRKPSGRFYTARNIVAFFLLASLIIIPFIKIDGHPLVILNLLERKFIIFGIAFGTHDFHLFGLAMISIFVSVFLFTVVYGRIFCGWMCPQTIFMEMVFRKIEYWIEGNSSQQKSLNKSAWSSEKVFKKMIKYIIFFAISFFISNIFLSYIIGMDELIRIISEPPSEHFTGLTAIIIFSLIFYWVFASFREQVCTLVCPYGRLQGVMLDKNSTVIAYDYKRGEPRGKLNKKNPDHKFGDCIDCYLCVHVCPTGIDIRNGTQLECVNCTACIDECDRVMTKVNRPRGLIRYASENEIENGKKTILTARAIGYTFVLVSLIFLLTFLLGNRSDFELSVLRTPGLMYQEQTNGTLSNLYDLKIINKTFKDFHVNLRINNMEGEIMVLGNDLIVEPQGTAVTKFLIYLDKSAIKSLNTPIEIAALSDGKVIDVVKTSFLGKVNQESKL